MKKTVLFFSIILFISVIPCFAKKKADVSGDMATETTEETKKAKSKKEKNDKSEKTDKKNYIGWIDTSGKDIDATFGTIHLKVRPKLGTFTISAVNEDNKSIPVLSNSNEYVSNYFSLKYNKKIYKLQAETNIKTAARKVANGIEMFYSIEDVADVNVLLECVESAPGEGLDMVRISSSLINKGPKKAELSQKLVLDTVLGESDKYHFYTSQDVPVQSEVVYRTLKNENWFCSKNSFAKLQFLLFGGDVSNIEAVALANYSTISKAAWIPEIQTYRAFDTVLSYNNSAIGIYWPQKTLGVNGKSTDTFYIALATGDDVPKGELFLKSKESVKQKALPPVTVPSIKEKSQKKTESEVIELDVQIAEPRTEYLEVTPVEPKEPVYDSRKLTVEQLTPEYIQNLLDRILILEESDEELNKDELNQLNAELDAILEALR